MAPTVPLNAWPSVAEIAFPVTVNGGSVLTTAPGPLGWIPAGGPQIALDASLHQLTPCGNGVPAGVPSGTSISSVPTIWPGVRVAPASTVNEQEIPFEQ